MRSQLLGLQALVRFVRFTVLFRKYSENQPRIPAGQPGAGEFTFGDGNPAASDKPVRLAQNRPRGGARAGRWPDATPGQEARLAATEMQANAALARVREIDGTWQPRPGLYENVEGEILANESVVRQAEARLSDLQRGKATPGPFAGESVAAPPDGKRTDAATQREIDRIGRETGCHTCGTSQPGTPLGNFVGDHQPPTALQRNLGQQRLFPQCLTCSRSQDGSVRGLLQRK